jgi:hypothetical protein
MQVTPRFEIAGDATAVELPDSRLRLLFFGWAAKNVEKRYSEEVLSPFVIEQQSALP